MNQDDDNLTMSSRKDTLDSRKSVVSISETIEELEEEHIDTHSVTIPHKMKHVTPHQMDLVGPHQIQMTSQMMDLENVSTENLQTYIAPDIVRIQQNGSGMIMAARPDHSGRVMYTFLSRNIGM